MHSMKLEVVVIPVADTERAKRFYASLGWRLDADFVRGDAFRVVQFTPPGSDCSLHFGTGLTQAAPGSAAGCFLVVSDIEAARADLVDRGVEVSQVFHRTGPGEEAIEGRHPARQTYASYATFSDPDGNRWLLQEVTARLPGRVDGDAATFSSPRDLAAALLRAEHAFGEHEKRTGQRDPDRLGWCASYLLAERTGKPLASTIAKSASPADCRT
jgi:catechol 2,3-dioxygenase-like lactoylglutathione lyase family enzyme